MIAMLRGEIAQISEAGLILDVDGVGYAVQASTRTLQRMPQSGQVQLMIETQVREDSITLFGFMDKLEQDWFRLLLGIQGVGSKVALAILTVLEPDALAAAITSQDKTAFTRASGVGPRLATRIVTELKERIGSLPNAAFSPGLAERPQAAKEESSDFNDALAALVNLGYGRSEAYVALTRAQSSDAKKTLSELIREGLKDLSS